MYEYASEGHTPLQLASEYARKRDFNQNPNSPCVPKFASSEDGANLAS